MKQVLRAAIIAALLNTHDGGGRGRIGNRAQAIRVQSSLNEVAALSQIQSQASTLNQSGSQREISLLQTESKMKAKVSSQSQSQLSSTSKAASKTGAGADQKNQAQWGFLKNIVNIDRFFASGPDDRKSSSKSLSQVSQQPKTTEKSKGAKKTENKEQKSKSKNSLSQVKSKNTEEELEENTQETNEQETQQNEGEEQTEASQTNNQEAAQEEPTQEQQDKANDDTAAQTKNEADNTVVENNNQEQAVSAETQKALDNAEEDLKASAKEYKSKKETEAEKPAQETQSAAQEEAPKPPTKDELKLAETDIENLKTKGDKEKHAEVVRNEGLLKAKNLEDNSQEIDLEIEAPGAANKVAEEGAQTVQSAQEYTNLQQSLEEARKKPENKLGKGGFAIDFKNPSEFESTMKVVVFNDPKKDENEIKVEKFDTHDPAQTQTASVAMAMTLQADVGATIVDDQPGKESIIQNLNSDNSKIMSQISSGYSIRNNLVQKMAPGDKQFHMVSWDKDKKFNNMKTFQKRALAEKDFEALGSIPKILIAGETGDVLLSNGDQSMVDQCLGMFYTQRYQGKYFGQP